MRKSSPFRNYPLLFALSMLTALSAFAQNAEEAAPGEGREWSVVLGLGGEYDTNVTVDEVDLSSGQSDYALIADFGVGMKQPLGEDASISVNYDISQSSYLEFSQVDRLTQILGTDFNFDLGSSNAGLSAYYIDSRLDGEGFLEYVRVSPSLSGFLSRRWFARGAYVYSERRIDDRQLRNADTHTGEGDLYYFHRGLRSYLNVGYRYRSEDSVAPELSFDAHSLKLRYIRRLMLGERRLKAELALRYEVREYWSAEPTIGEPRDDDRLRVKADLEVPLGEKLNWQLYYSYGDYQSNLPRADFTQSILGTRLQYKW